MHLPKHLIRDDDCLDHFFSMENLSADFSTPFVNYLLYGWEPGSAFRGILANNFFDAIFSSHPSNTIESYKAIGRVIINYFPKQAYGSIENVKSWVFLNNEQRRRILEDEGLVKTPFQILKDS